MVKQMQNHCKLYGVLQRLSSKDVVVWQLQECLRRSGRIFQSKINSDTKKFPPVQTPLDAKLPTSFTTMVFWLKKKVRGEKAK